MENLDNDLPPASRLPLFRALEREATTGPTGALPRLYESLARFTVLTDHVRSSVDERLAPHLLVTGWSGGVLRVYCDQPALATRWRFLEPGIRRRLASVPALAGLREIRLASRARPLREQPEVAPSTLAQAPAEALHELARSEAHARLRQALERLASDAERARRGQNSTDS